MSSEEEKLDEMSGGEKDDYIERIMSKISERVAVVVPYDAIYGGNWLYEGRRKETDLEGEVEKRLNNVLQLIEKERKKADVPEEYRRYIKREDIPKLPKGTRVHQGLKGGLFVDVREVPRDLLPPEEAGVRERGVGEGRVRSGSIRDGKEVEVNVRDGASVKFALDESGRIVGFKKVSGIKRRVLDAASDKVITPSWNKRLLYDLIEKESGIPLLLDAASVRILGKVGRGKFSPLASELFGSVITKEVREKLGKQYLSQRFEYAFDKFFMEPGAQLLSKRRKYIEMFLEKFRQDFDGRFCIVKLETISKLSPGAAGFYGLESDIYLLDDWADYPLIHEYLHHIYKIYQRAKNLKHWLDYYVDGVLSELKIGLDDLLGQFSNATEEDELAVLRSLQRIDRSSYLRLFREYVERAVEEGDFADDEDAEVKKTILTLYQKYDKIIDELGGPEALEMFDRLNKFFTNIGGGLTQYSRKHRKEKIATEGLASAGDLLHFVFNLLRSTLPKNREMGEMIMRKYGDNPIDWINPEVIELLATKYENFRIDMDKETLSRLCDLMRKFFKQIRLVVEK